MNHQNIETRFIPASSHYSMGRTIHYPSVEFYETPIETTVIDSVFIKTKFSGSSKDSMTQYITHVGDRKIESTPYSLEVVQRIISEYVSKLENVLESGHTIPSSETLSKANRIWKREVPVGGDVTDGLIGLFVGRTFTFLEKRFLAYQLIKKNMVSYNQLLNFLTNLEVY